MQQGGSIHQQEMLLWGNSDNLDTDHTGLQTKHWDMLKIKKFVNDN